MALNAEKSKQELYATLHNRLQQLNRAMSDLAGRTATTTAVASQAQQLGSHFSTMYAALPFTALFACLFCMRFMLFLRYHSEYQSLEHQQAASAKGSE
jgi:hypothetical protein